MKLSKNKRRTTDDGRPIGGLRSMVCGLLAAALLLLPTALIAQDTPPNVFGLPNCASLSNLLTTNTVCIQTTTTGGRTAGHIYLWSLASGSFSDITSSPSGSGTVTSISTTSPLTGGPITTTGSIACQVASGSQAGCLSAADWTTFNSFGTGSGTAPVTLGTAFLTVTLPNETVTGTTAGLLVKVTGAPPKAKTIATTDIDGIFGICVNVTGSTLACGTSGNANIAVLGQVSCQFDGATTAGDYVIASTTSAGKCHDSGSSSVYPTGVAVLGTVQSTNGAGGTYTMFLQTPDVASASGANGGGGKGTALSVNSSASKIQANFNASTPAAGAGNLNITWQSSSSGNTTSVSAEVPASGLLDVIGSTRGTVLYRGATGWSALVPVAAGRVLTDGGIGADPSWAAAAGGPACLSQSSNELTATCDSIRIKPAVGGTTNTVLQMWKDSATNEVWRYIVDSTAGSMTLQTSVNGGSTYTDTWQAADANHGGGMTFFPTGNHDLSIHTASASTGTVTIGNTANNWTGNLRFHNSATTAPIWINKTSLTPVTTWAAGVPSANPTGFIVFVESDSALVRYIPFWQ